MPLTKAQAKSLDILEVARSLGMEMKRKSHREYYWAEHDSFKIDTVKNTWHWYSQADKYGDTINLVQEMRNVSYKEAMVFLETGSFPEAKPVEEERKPFNYTLAPYEQRFVEARSYLKEIRGLSDDTIDFFLEKGVLAQAKRKDKDGVIEDVLVFKYLDRNQQLVGASLQGLVPDQERHPGKGYLKQIMYQSESISGLNVSIGSPKRLIVTEAPIDLMSYYELHKGELNDVRLVAMEGLKEGVLSHYVLEILQERGELTMDERDYTKSSELTRTSNFLSVAAETSTLFQDHKYDDLITLAVDHDKAGTDFITKLREKKIPVIDGRPPKREGQEKTDWNEILKQEKQLEQTEEIQSSSHFPDTSHLSPEDAAWLKENWNNIGFSVEPRKQMVIDSDKTVTYEKPSNPFGDGREPKKQIQSTEKAPENSQEQMNDRTSGGTGSLQPKAEGSTSPVLETSTFEQTVTSHPTSSYPYLQFSTNYDKVQRRTANYHPITPADLRRLNQYAPSIQSTASWYLNELADSKISFVYADHGEKNVLQVTFQKDNFIHLSGIRPFEEGKGAANFLDDIANGQGHYDGMLISNAIKDKLQVLPMLRDILDPHSFVLDDLSSVEKLHNLNMSEAIKAKDEDFLLLFKDIGDEKIPASLMKLKGELATNVKSLDEKIILGVYRDRDGHIEQLSINEEYVKDNGAEMLSVLKNKQFEEVSKEIEQTMLENTLNSPLLDSATFTQVLDTVYNLGVPGNISKTPEEFHQAWNQYLDYAKQHNDKFDQIVAAAGEDNLLDKNSDFYRDWHQDHIYKDDYHIRLQWSEDRPDGPKLPFKETELISYQDFAKELYKANQDFYPIHQEGMKQVTAGNTEGYIPPTKIKFDVYAPGGEMIKEGIRYDIGDETTPISQMLGLGYRRLNGQSELASMDEEILSQLENREVNKEISQEANESSRLIEEGEGQTPDTRKTVAFQSSKQETKTNLLQRVEEILKEEPISDLETPEVNSSSIDYATLTPHELSEVAFQKVREYTETPERLEEYLNFMSKFPELSPRNVALIQEQWPGANAVATYNQWQSMGEVLGITSDQVFETRNTYTNKKTGRTREVVHNNLSVKTGEKSHITLFRPMMVEMIPVLDENGNQVKNGKGNPKYKRLSEATPEEKALKKEGKLKSRFFQERDSNTGLAKFATYKVFELSQTTLKPEFYPKAMPNRHYDFNMDHIRTKEVLEGLSDYAKGIGVTIYQDDAKELKSARGAFYSDEQKILLNPDNTPGEVIATTIHELAHASLHNPKFANSYKEDVSKDRRELEAEMTSYLVSKHFGLDTSEKAIRYMAIWTNNLTSLDDQQLAQSMKRIHGTVSKIVKSVEQHTKPYQLNRQVVQNQNFIQSPKKGLKV